MEIRFLSRSMKSGENCVENEKGCYDSSESLLLCSSSTLASVRVAQKHFQKLWCTRLSR